MDDFYELAAKHKVAALLSSMMARTFLQKMIMMKLLQTHKHQSLLLL